jgi:signal transduction histidine kinase
MSQTSPASAEELSSIIDHINASCEQEKTRIARTLHDDMGGLLVGALMDVSMAELHSDSATLVKDRLGRVKALLKAAIDLKRNLIESIHPSLLENVGLFAAARWHAQAVCAAANVACQTKFPEVEPKFCPEARTILYRILEQGIGIMLARGVLSDLELSVAVDDDALQIQIAGLGGDAGTLNDADASLALGSLTQRAAGLGGTIHVASVRSHPEIVARFMLDPLVRNPVPPALS